jgi:putative Holliday junction resolvase
MRILGIDYGKTRVGLAFLNTNIGVSLPITILNCKGKNVYQELLKIIKEKNIDCLVIGKPLRTNQEESLMTEEVFNFAEKLKEYCLKNSLSLKVFFEDERYSSIIAKDKLKGQKNLKQKLDSVSAQIILENYFLKNK